MKSFLLFLCLAAAEKLDRTYLPPPGAKFSGGAPGDIQVPFEIPKETYSTTVRPEINNGALSPEDTRIEIGINRGVPMRPASEIIATDIEGPSEYNRNNYNVPTTTTSYAFTTTTTHPRDDGYETTTGPINPVTGLPISKFDFPTSAPGFTNSNIYNQGNQQVPFRQQPGQVPSSGPIQYSVPSALAPNSQFINQNRPGFVQDNNFGLVQNQRPGFPPGSTMRPSLATTNGDFLPTDNAKNNQFNSQDNQRPGFQPGFIQRPVNVPGYQSTSIPNTFEPGTTPTTIQYGGDQGTIFNQKFPFSKQSNYSVPPQNTQVSYYPGQNQFQQNKLGQQIPQRVSQQGSNKQTGGAQYGSPEGEFITQQYPDSQIDAYGRPVIQNNNINLPISTVSPTLPVANSNQYPGNYSGSQSSATTMYRPGSSPITPIYPRNENQQITTGLTTRPERPQAESDRNAVILNYENIITPEGFAYSFDTSNGIHADESGTALDGVKAKGSYSYIGDDGKLYSIVYTADENGFIPHGDHIPTAPPIPEAIKKVIEQVRKEQEDGISDDGTYDEDKYGHMKYQSKRPQRPNRVNIDRGVAEKYDGYNKQADRRPQYSQQSPIIPNETEYEDSEDDQGQLNGADVTSYDQGRSIDKKPSRRPVNRIPEKYDDNYNSQFDSGNESDQAETTSKKPSQYSDNRPVSDRRQFGGKFSVQRPDQYSDDVEYNVNGDYNKKLPTNGQVFTDKDEYKVDDNRLPHNQRPSSFSGQFPTPSATGSFQDKYGNKINPIASTSEPFGQTEAYDYQNSKTPGGLNQYLPGQNSFKQLPSSSTSAPNPSQFTEPSVQDNIMYQGIGDVSKYSQSPNRQLPRIPVINYDDSNTYRLVDSQTPDTGNLLTNRPSSSSSYRPSQESLQTSTTSALQQDEKYVTRVTKPGIYNQVQTIRRPVPGRQPSGTNKYTTVTPLEEDKGYQYLPPQMKFEQDSRYPGVSEVISTGKMPLKNIIYSNRGEVAKPFTTPDASRSDDIQDDEYDHVQDINQFSKPQNTQIRPYQQPVSTGKPILNQGAKYGKKTDITDIPEENDKTTTIGSTRRPSFQQIQTTTAQPQRPYGPTVSVYKTAHEIPAGAVQSQGGNRYPEKYGDKTTYSTTPASSQTSQYEGTQSSTLKPGQQNTNRYTGDQTPATQYFFPTTTRPAQSQGRSEVRPTQNIYQQTPSQSPYQTTYIPITTISSGIDAGQAPSTTIRPGKIPFRRPGYSQNLPSTTYRPSFFPGETSTEKVITIDNFGRPTPESEMEKQQGYKPGYPGKDRPTSQGSYRPQSETIPGLDIYGRPTGPFVQGNLSSPDGPTRGSTTEKIFGEDFSGPKQAQKFDPEQGYYY